MDDQKTDVSSKKDSTDLVAAALGLKSSAWAKAMIVLVDLEPKFNADINGKPYIRGGKRVTPKSDEKH